MPRPLQVFLCHASQDKPEVWKLHRYLKTRGVKPWLDQADLLPGEHWETEIPNAIFSSDVILVCLSKNSVNKEGYVQKEIAFALDKALEKPEGTIFIVPVKLEDCELPKRLSRYQAVDLYRTDGRKRLLMGLNKRVTNLGEEVLPITIEEIKQRTPKPETKQEEKKEQVKPFATVDNPSSLNLRRKSQTKENRSAYNFRRLGIGGIVLLVILFAGSYLINNFPANPATEITPSVTLEPSILTATITPIVSITPMPTLGIRSTMISEKDGMVLVYVPAGEFMMGSDSFSDERPIHQVYLDTYWIDQTEVTNSMYAHCVNANQCNQPLKTSSYTHFSYFGNSQFDNYPVMYVLWNDAKDYCEYVGRRLPTEAEWEKAARGTDGNIYPWGNNTPANDLLNYNLEIGETTEVGNYPIGASIYGALDMAGNVWEWVSDYYDSNYYQISPSSNPLGPGSGNYRVLRGGSWYNNYNDVRSALRYGVDPSYNSRNFGFRCAMDAEN